jgi:hypothetical protein
MIALPKYGIFKEFTKAKLHIFEDRIRCQKDLKVTNIEGLKPLKIKLHLQYL